ncbi:hypothetical protein KPL70_017375 [Citrus sinensis]|nr:hypothetical protein KPL70_017375 [Citrus sinensis]
MSLQRERGSLARPPALDGTNYAHWKQMMEIYLTAIDERVWQCILTGYTPPIKIGEDGVEFLKPVKEWTNDELDTSGYNAKELNAIVNGVDVYYPKILAIEEYADMSAMIRGSLIGKLMVYETNYLNLDPKKGKCIAFQVETEAPVTKSSEDDYPFLYVDNSLALIAKNFKKMLKKKNFNKLKKTSTLVAPKVQKAMQSTWSDDNSNDSIDEEDLLRGLVVHNDGSKQESNIINASTSEASHLAPCKEDIDSHLDTIVQHVNQNNNSDSDEEVYNENVTLMTQVSNLLDDKAKLESEVIHYKSLLTDKDNQLLAVTTELENTKKSLKMISSGTQKLNHILSLGKSSSDHHGLGYQHSKDSNSQSVFVKASSQTASPPIVKLLYLQKDKVVAHSSPVHQGKVTPEVRVIEKSQSSEPPLKEKELVEEDTSKETPEIMKEKFSKLQAIMLVAQGYTQIEGVDFDETFAPVARIESIRLLFAVTCLIGFKLFQMDVKSAFLNGILNEEAYVEQSKGFEDPYFRNHVFKLKKALYGLKQTPRAWYERLTKFLLENSYKRGGVDKTLFIKQLNPGILVIQVYVDDIVFGSTSSDHVQEFVSQMKREFEMSMVGVLTYFLGLQVKKMENGIFVNQSKYAKSLVKRFGLDSAKHLRTPMSTNAKFIVDDSGSSVDPSLYRSMIGSLLYLTATRPDICFSVGVCARYQANPKESHLTTVKRIIRFVTRTVNDGIWYTNDTNSSLAGYSDADWAGNADDRKSTTGGCFYLGNNLVSWHSRKQNSISLFTVEAEYIAAGSCCTKLLWMKQMLADYGIVQDILTVFCDNTSAINISKNLVQHSRTKHIDIRHHFIRDLVESKTLNIGESSHANSNPERHPTLTLFICFGCGRPHEIHILDDDEDFGPKFGQIPPEESMHSSDSDSMESDPNEDSFHSGPSFFDPRITTNATIVHVAITDHQSPPHAPSHAVTNGTPPSTLHDLPTFVAASVCSSPPPASFAHNLEATILKQGQDIANLSTRLAKLHAKLLPFCNLLAKERE